MRWVPRKHTHTVALVASKESSFKNVLRSQMEVNLKVVGGQKFA